LGDYGLFGFSLGLAFFATCSEIFNFFFIHHVASKFHPYWNWWAPPSALYRVLSECLLAAKRLDRVQQQCEVDCLCQEQEKAKEIAWLKAKAAEEEGLEPEWQEAEKWKLAEERQKADKERRMAKLEAKAAKSSEEMEDEEPTPKRQRTAKGKGVEDLETDRMEVGVTGQMQWKVDGDWRCDVCQAKDQDCRWRVSGRQGTACKWCLDHKVRCKVSGKLVKADGGVVASGLGPKKARSVSRKTLAMTVTLKVSGWDNCGQTFEPVRFLEKHGQLVEDVPLV
jgi:hypothetical protein